MILIHQITGNVNDSPWRERCQGMQPDAVSLSASDAQKHKFRTKTQNGEAVALSLPRHVRISNGDILYFDSEKNQLITAKVLYPEVMLITFEHLNDLAPDHFLSLGFHLGHALGNQHWPAVLKGRTVYVPVAVDRKVMLSAMKTHRFTNITLDFISGEEACQQLVHSEVRLLFGSSSAHHHSDEHNEPSAINSGAQE